nr:COBRA-like protein 4 [Ipomoea batatas]
MIGPSLLGFLLFPVSTIQLHSSPCVAPFSSRQKPEGRRRRRSSRSRGSPPRGGVAVHQKPEGRLGLVAEAEVEAVGRSREAEAASAAWTLGGGCVGLVDSRRRRLLASCKQLAASRGGRRNQGQQLVGELESFILARTVLGTMRNVVVICVFAAFFSYAAAYDPLDPTGNITIKWDVMSWTPDGYVVSDYVLSVFCSPIFCFSCTECVFCSSFSVSPVSEGDLNVVGVYLFSVLQFSVSLVTECVFCSPILLSPVKCVFCSPILCISVSEGDLNVVGRLSVFCSPVFYFSCYSNTFSVPDSLNSQIVAKVGFGFLGPGPSGFRVSVPGQRRPGWHVEQDCQLPKNFTLLGPGPGYTCGPAKIVPSTKFFTPDLRRKTQALMTWNVTCTFSQFLARKHPSCCVSLSTFYNETITSCPHCACGCESKKMHQEYSKLLVWLEINTPRKDNAPLLSAHNTCAHQSSLACEATPNLNNVTQVSASITNPLSPTVPIRMFYGMKFYNKLTNGKQGHLGMCSLRF